MQLNDLIYLGRRLAQAGQLAMRSETPGLDAAEARVLADLLDRRFSTVTEIAQRTGYAQGRVSTAVGALREAGLVGARPDTADRRRTVVFATDRADEHAATLRQRSADGLLESLLAATSLPEQAAVDRALTVLLEAMRQRDLAITQLGGPGAARRDP